MFVDNISCHKSKKVKQFLKQNNGEIVLKYFLPYTPQLNNTENQWLNIKRTTANKLYESVSGARKSIRKMLRNGEIVISKMSGYLR